MNDFNLELANLKKCRLTWIKLNQVFKILAYIFIVISTIFAFLEQIWTWMSFFSGIINTCALLALIMSAFSESEVHKKTELINNIIKENERPVLNNSPEPVFIQYI